MVSPTSGPWKRDPKAYSSEALNVFSPCDWHGSRAPTLDWVVESGFITGTVGLLNGDGGLGKSLLCQQLATCAAIGHEWLGLTVKRCTTLAVFCEDDRDELQRRQERINRHYHCEMQDLEDVVMVERAGMDNVLFRFGRWGDQCQPTDLWHRIKEQVMDLGAQILIIDTIADVFSGNEIDRNQPRTFIRQFRRLAIEMQGVVIFTQHPSVEGMKEGSGRSGSTGWRNSVRSMLYLTAEKDDKEGNRRVLKTMKLNSGPRGNKLNLVFKAGVFCRSESLYPSYDSGDPRMSV